MIGKFGDCPRDLRHLHAPAGGVRAAAGAATGWRRLGRARNTTVEVDLRYSEGKWVGAGEPMMYITGSFFHLVDLETIFLQKLGPACVAAYNAWTMCADMPKSAFLAMDARHCAGQEMAEMMAYAASVGSARAKRKVGAVGFIGNATHATAHFFGREQGLGTMPHALIGYAGSTVRAAEMFHETFPGEPMTVLVDYFAREISRLARGLPALSRPRRARACCRCASTPPAAATSKGSIRRRPTPCWSASRPNRSAAIAARRSCAISSAPAYRRRRSSICAHELDRAGFDKVKIVASSGFGPAKCRVMAEAKAPIDVVGSGSFLPSNWTRDLRHRRHRRI